MKILSALACWVGLSLLAPIATAQERPLDPVLACLSISPDAERLSCFDREVKRLRSEETDGRLAVVTSDQIRRVETEAFGLKLPSVPALTGGILSGGAKGAAPMEALTLRVDRLEVGSDGRMRLVMENGQVWRQTDDIRLGGLGKGPWRAEIRRAALGSYMVKLDGRTAFRAERRE
ncbi:MAG: hypothetical protein KGS00_11490 [Alphaproteobacteria bacterium]|nr:hypothetical protein [Alphaproteobacteria bacterium]